MKIICLFIILILSFNLASLGQSLKYSKPPLPYGPQPELNRPMPDFSLDNVDYSHRRKVSLSDFKGKWLVLDFWGVTCTSCITSFPKINELQKKFKDSVSFLLVGLNSKMGTAGAGLKIKQTYDRLANKYKLMLASGYDSTMFIRWGIWGVPKYIVIDPYGIVRFISPGRGIDEEGIKSLLNGNHLFEAENEYARYDASGFSSIQSSKVLYRSILSKGNGEKGRITVLNEFSNGLPPGGLTFVMCPLKSLYLNAYFGTPLPHQLSEMLVFSDLIFECSDTILFEYDYSSKDFEGLYNYNLVLDSPSSRDIEYVKEIFQHELRYAFGYEVKIEKRSMPVLKLVAKPGAASKLKTKGDKEENMILYMDLELNNTSTNTVSKLVAGSLKSKNIPVYDETGIVDNIDIKFSGSILDENDVIKSLRKNGLDLVEGEREMSVLIVKSRVRR